MGDLMVYLIIWEHQRLTTNYSTPALGPEVWNSFLSKEFRRAKHFWRFSKKSGKGKKNPSNWWQKNHSFMDAFLPFPSCIVVPLKLFNFNFSAALSCEWKYFALPLKTTPHTSIVPNLKSSCKQKNLIQLRNIRSNDIFRVTHTFTYSR